MKPEIQTPLGLGIYFIDIELRRRSFLNKIRCAVNLHPYGLEKRNRHYDGWYLEKICPSCEYTKRVKIPT